MTRILEQSEEIIMMSSGIVAMHNTLNLQKLKQDIHLSLKTWHSAGLETSPLDYLWLFHDLQRREHTSVHATTNKLLLHVLDRLATSYPDEADVLRNHFLNGIKMYKLAVDKGIAEATVYRRQDDGLQRLVELLTEQEQHARIDYVTRQEQRLVPPIYTLLVFHHKWLEDLEQLLLPGHSPWLVAVTGLGGIGKTTVADAVARHLIRRGVWDEIGWVTAKSTILNLVGDLETSPYATLTTDAIVRSLLNQLFADEPVPLALSTEEAVNLLDQRLHERAHIIIVDNLESIQDLKSLLPILRRLANPSKFLLTSRESLYEEPLIYHIRLLEVDEPVALRLVRHEAQESNLSDVAQASDQELHPIYKTIGGNPLALRLVVGQLHTHPLAELLADLNEARGKAVENLFTHIYQRAWESLDETERLTWLAMPTVSEQGGTIDLLSAITELERADLRKALSTLVKLNLIDRRGGLNDVRYTIHALTRTFLHNAYT